MNVVQYSLLNNPFFPSKITYKFVIHLCLEPPKIEPKKFFSCDIEKWDPRQQKKREEEQSRGNPTGPGFPLNDVKKGRKEERKKERKKMKTRRRLTKENENFWPTKNTPTHQIYQIESWRKSAKTPNFKGEKTNFPDRSRGKIELR